MEKVPKTCKMRNDNSFAMKDVESGLCFAYMGKIAPSGAPASGVKKRAPARNQGHGGLAVMVGCNRHKRIGDSPRRPRAVGSGQKDGPPGAVKALVGENGRMMSVLPKRSSWLLPIVEISHPAKTKSSKHMCLCTTKIKTPKENARSIRTSNVGGNHL